MHCLGVTILGVLNQKHHEKRDDGGRGIDDQLPCVGEMKCRPGDEPNKNDEHGTRKCPGAAEHDRGTVRENAERVAYHAKEIAFLLVPFYFSDLSPIHSAT